jgi:predicted TIM-barrel fold metal-dependent hydrolase
MFVKDDAGGHGGPEGSRIAQRPPAAGGGADFLATPLWAAAEKLGVPLVLEAFGTPWHDGTIRADPRFRLSALQAGAGLDARIRLHRARLKPSLATGLLHAWDKASRRFGRLQIRA